MDDLDENNGVEDREENDGVDREEKDGADERLDRDGTLKLGELDRLVREPNDGIDRELNAEPPEERPPNERPPNEPPLRALCPPDERETEALRAQAELGAASARTTVASPRVRTTKWCDNI